MIKTINYNYFKSLVLPRPTGSKNNNDIIGLLKETALALGYNTQQLPFNCVVWDKAKSFFEADGERIEIFTGPFSPAVEGTGDLCFISSTKELRQQNITDKIVILRNEIAREPISPKDFPYYYPENHKEINDLLEEKKPLAIIAATGKHPMCGLDPFPLFEDGNFSIPSAYIRAANGVNLDKFKSGKIKISSTVTDSQSSQLIIRKSAATPSAPTIIVCAHVDTAYNTPGALDNAVGLSTMLQIMEQLKDNTFNCNFEFIPFNGEDYFDITGQRTYLEKYPIAGRSIKLVLNIDDAGHIGSKNALSCYGLDNKTESILQALIENSDTTVIGPQWYESDHAMFIYNNIPAIVFASSDLHETTVALTHTPSDTVDAVDFSLIEHMSNFAVQLFHQLGFTTI